MIKLTYDGQTYELTFTRKSVVALEKLGFKFDEVDTHPATCLPLLFRGSFIAKHPFVKQDKIDEIYDAVPNKTDLIVKLGELYAETLNSLFDEPKEDQLGKVTWELAE